MPIPVGPKVAPPPPPPPPPMRSLLFDLLDLIVVVLAVPLEPPPPPMRSLVLDLLDLTVVVLAVPLEPPPPPPMRSLVLDLLDLTVVPACADPENPGAVAGANDVGSATGATRNMVARNGRAKLRGMASSPVAGNSCDHSTVWRIRNLSRSGCRRFNACRRREGGYG